MNEFVELYLSLFAGRPDVYAIRREWVKNDKPMSAYLPSTYASDDGKKQYSVDQITEITENIGTREYGPEAVRVHLKGEHFLGVYPMHADSTVRFFALDFDGDTFEAAWEEAMAQQKILAEEAGLVTYAEISRSGNGVHLWGFLDFPCDARKVRIALRPFLLRSDSYDRMFPNQDSVNELRPLGNLIALPLFGPTVKEGKGVFAWAHTKTGAPVIAPSQKDFLLHQIERISMEKIYALFESTPDEFHTASSSEARPHTAPTEVLRGAYKLVSPMGCEWMRWQWESPEEVKEPDWYMLACQLTQFENGRELFHSFSSRSTRYDHGQTDSKYDSALSKNAPQTCEYIREHTQGPPCYCDEKWEDVRAPYQVANLSMKQLIAAAEAEQPDTSSLDLIRMGIDRARAIEANPEGEMGFRYGTPLDEYTSMRNGELIVIASRPSIGKTASGLDILTNVVNEQDSPGFCISMEMGKDALSTRIVGREAEVDHGRILTGKLTSEDWEKIEAAEARLSTRSHHIWVDDRTKSTDRILDVVGEWVYQHGKGPLVVDYLQLGKKLKGESTFDAVSRMAYEYKAMAKILEIPVVALTQLNRSADEATEDSQTYDHWLRNSGDIEAAADVIMIMLGERTNDEVSSRTMVIHKERQRGAGPRVKLDFHQAWQRFAAEGTWRTGLQLKNHADYALRDPLLPARGGLPLGGTLFEVTS